MNYVLLDRFLKLEAGRELVAAKTFSEPDALFNDHFPGFPVVPGTLLTEAMVQAGGWLIVCTLQFSRWPLLCMIEKAKFRRFVRPGELLTVRSRLVSLGNKSYQTRGEILVEDQRVAECDVFFHGFATDSGPGGSFDAAAFNQWARTTFERLGGDVLADERSERGRAPCI